MPPIERKLVAILAADVAGYSRLMHLDEVGTARALHSHMETLRPIFARHGGRIVDTAGDGILLEFPSIVAAVECAVAAQRLMASRNADVPEDQRMHYRLGIHIGDILIEGDRIRGDGINIAARLESIAAPGGICLSEDAYRQVRGKVAIEFADMGEQRLKNIAQPLRTYRVLIDGEAQDAPTPPPIPDRPSIAVLPFQNMSAETEQQYFADGIVEEIITAMSRFGHLFVIARNSSFAYRGRAVDAKQVGRELGVRYLLEGSVRKAADRVRITGQLIDTATGAHLWADRFDGSLEDIFDLQDQVTASVVGAITPKLEQAEIERAKRKFTENLDAYDYYLRGVACFYQATTTSVDEALSLFHKAIERDPAFASAYGLAARCHTWRKAAGWSADWSQDIAEAARLARRAVELGKNDALALCTGGFALAHAGDLDQAAECIDRAIALNPNLAWAWYHGGWVSAWRGEAALAIERFTRALRLSPLDPLISRMQSGIAFAHFLAGRYQEGCVWAEKALLAEPNFVVAFRILAANQAMAGQSDKARTTLARLLRLTPTQTIATLSTWAPFGRPQDFSKWVEALRLAGMRE